MAARRPTQSRRWHLVFPWHKRGGGSRTADSWVGLVFHTPGVYAGLSSVNTRNNHRFIIPRFLVQGTWRTGQHHAEGSHLEKLCGRRGNGEEKTEVTTTGTEKNVRKVLGDIFITNSHSLWTQYYQQSRTGLSVTAPLSFAAINLYFPFIVPFFRFGIKFRF